jgi:hypothetical protein
MPRTNTQVRTNRAVAQPAAAENEDLLSSFSNVKKVIEIEDPETALGVEEKPEEETAAAGEEEDELATDEAGIDDEELNPFGDKWEQ